MSMYYNHPFLSFEWFSTSIFLLFRLDDGAILDEKAFRNDFINLAHSIGAYLYEDLLCIVSLRYQTIHVLQIRDSGNLVEVRKIGAFCQEDDELFLHSHGQVPTDPYGKIAGSIFSLHHSWYWSCITSLIKLVSIALEPWAFIVQIIVTRKKHALRCVWSNNYCLHLKQKSSFTILRTFLCSAIQACSVIWPNCK